MTITDPEVFTFEAGATWYLRQVYTQTGAGGGNIAIAIVPGEGVEFEIMYGTTGADDYGAGRTITSTIRDTGRNIVSFLREAASVDNKVIPILYMVETAPGDGEPNIVNGKYSTIVSGNMRFELGATSLILNETFTFAVCIRLHRGGIVAVDRTNSTGTVGAPTTTESDVK